MSTNTRWLFHLRALPQAALAVAACAGASSALAQSAGQTLYRTTFPISGGADLSCEDCHGPAYIFKAASSAGAISSAISANRGGMAVFATLTATQINEIAAYVAAALPPPPPPPFSPPPAGTPVTPMASPNPATPSASTSVGSTSAVFNVQFTNTGSTNVTFSTPFGVATGDAADFLVATPTAGNAQCINGRVMAPGTSCWFGFQFKPTAAGTRTATWTMNFTGGVAPRTVTLQGSASTAAAPTPAPAPAPSANAPTSGGGGALDWLTLSGLGLLAGAAARRRTSR